jgi:adenine phosphoribosyltransferase
MSGTISLDARLERLRGLVQAVPDFPKPGILFRDITPVLAEASAFADAIAGMAEPFLNSGVDAVVGIESRGFVFGAPIALRLGAGFVPVRKPGKLPRATERVEYALEYGSDALEVHRDALHGKRRVLVVDDVIATGGTARASVELVRLLGAEVVAAAFFVELTFLRGAEQLSGLRVESLLRY